MNEALTLFPETRPSSVEAWAAGGARFRWDGHDVFYRDQGEGEALLLLHGIPTASWAWHRVWPLLRHRHRLVAIDLLGFGLSDKPRELVADVAAQARMCRALLTRIGVARYRVLAGDYGASIAQELLVQRGYPAIASVCLLNGGFFPEAYRPSPGQRFVGTRPGRPFARLIWRGAFARSLRRMSGPGTQPDDATIGALFHLLTMNGGRRVLPAMMGYHDARRRNRDRWVGALTRARMPLRFICGTADPVAGRAMAESWRAHLPGRDVVELPGIGHWPELEAPGALADAVLKFHGPEEEAWDPERIEQFRT